MSITRIRVVARRAVLGVGIFNALSAVAGGVLLIIGGLVGGSGGMGIPESVLDGTPFASFLWPGVILLIVVGGTQVAAVVLQLARAEWAPFAVAVAGFGLAIWMFVEVAMLPGFSFWQGIYFGTAVAQLALLTGWLGAVPSDAFAMRTASADRSFHWAKVPGPPARRATKTGAMNTVEAGGNARKIVVGIDGSERSIAALWRAVPLADALGASIHLVAVWQYPSIGGGVFPAEADLFKSWARGALVDARRAVWGDVPPASLTASLSHGSPARVLIDESRHAEMLVVGSRGHGGFAGLMLGSVSMAVAEHAECPVLVVHDITTAEHAPTQVAETTGAS
jgi:nucleotide-binding universal stress UspA family protein